MVAAILAKPSKGYKSAIYLPILMKFETQVLISLTSWKITKPDVQAGNKMAADAIFENQQTAELGHLWTDFHALWNVGTHQLAEKFNFLNCSAGQ